MVVFESAIFWIIVAAASEIIALSPLKDNSILQLVFHEFVYSFMLQLSIVEMIGFAKVLIQTFSKK